MADEMLDRETWKRCQKRAPGWRVRCLRCGYKQHWGRFGIRRGAASWKKWTLGFCKRCRRIACHAIEKGPVPVEPEGSSQDN